MKLIKQVKKPPKRPNPFAGATDIYLTPNKIAVITTINTSAKRGYTKITKTKYYEQNASNLRLLKSANITTVRVGRKSNNYKQV